MAVSLAFMSTLPSLLPLYHQPLSTTATRCFTDGICCHKIQATVPHEDGIRRRDVLRFVGATVGMELVACSGSCVEMANAADLIQLKQRSEFLSSIKKTLNSFLKGNMELIPSILTLALNDAMTYDKATKSGGPNGSIRFSSEIIRPENKGLSAALKLLEEAKHEIDSYSKGGPISFADLIQYAAQSAIKSTFLASAIRKCGGNEEKGALLYTAYGSNGQLAVMSAFIGPDQMAIETLLASDPDVKPWVQKYQRSRETVSQTDYEVDLITTLTKLSCLGQQINYEAYTYPIKKVDFSKLKL
ncbi:thylakoid lumenal 29 kDa protein, chloroplastic isoform X2 [Macadamia integrifolia]|uniref:thylakoid lumenal 29 kDa protein, chloroplastic isoform X2 n=1 Tax=Macadamia integrifolia TaxID=60698 RepID=UPI001C4E91F0|nr:thylakoid lumenal 29 kDa protein, chloroplastic isoform X2 [Macadamia integrifolia]